MAGHRDETENRLGSMKIKFLTFLSLARTFFCSCFVKRCRREEDEQVYLFFLTQTLEPENESQFIININDLFENHHLYYSLSTSSDVKCETFVALKF